MAFIRVCDKCNNIIDETERYYHGDIEERVKYRDNILMPLDLCYECYDKLLNFTKENKNVKSSND